MAYYEHIVQLSNNEFKCTLCDDIIHRLLEEHLHGKKHKELYFKSLMTINNITVGTADLFCYICNHNIPVADLISHIQSINHQNKYSSIKELVTKDGDFLILPEVKSKVPSAHCIICNRPVELINDCIEKHISSHIHREAKAMVLQPLNAIFSVEGHDQYLWCKMCDIFFDNYIELIFQHVYESIHAKKMAKISRIISGQHIDLDKYLQDYKEDKALCSKCKILVPCNVDNLQSHINGKNHLKKCKE